MSDTRLIYETKCRRCGSFYEWFVADAGQMKWINFAKGMQAKINDTGLYDCEECKKPTVQDVVSYTSFTEEIRKIEYEQ